MRGDLSKNEKISSTLPFLKFGRGALRALILV